MQSVQRMCTRMPTAPRVKAVSPEWIAGVDRERFGLRSFCRRYTKVASTVCVSVYIRIKCLLNPAPCDTLLRSYLMRDRAYIGGTSDLKSLHHTSDVESRKRVNHYGKALALH